MVGIRMQIRFWSHVPLNKGKATADANKHPLRRDAIRPEEVMVKFRSTGPKEMVSGKVSGKNFEKYTLILTYLQENKSIDNARARQLTGKSEQTVRRYLRELQELEIVYSQGSYRDKIYVLKER